MLKIFLFILPIGILFAVIFFAKTDRYFAYNYMKGDCEARGLHFYNKIYNEKNTVDYLFIGSSKTMNGINDSMMERIINTNRPQHVNLFNAGYCRFGRNMDALLLKEFLKNNSIKKLFLEVRHDEATNSHPMFAFAAEGKEILSSAKAMNTSFFKDSYDHFLMNLKYERCKFNLEHCDSSFVPKDKFGFNNIDKIVEEKELDKFLTEKTKEWKDFKVDKNTFAYKFSNYYLNEIKTLCEKNNIELNFIYFPNYANIIKTPAFAEEYQKMGKLILGPDSLFTNKKYWKDNGHFNTFGANAYSKFLVSKIGQ